ncbi:MAG: transposase [Candidatus Omnitrophota bacterium]
MPRRKLPLVESEIYHVYNKSIAGFEIFKNPLEYERMLRCIIFYNLLRQPCKFFMFEKMIKKSLKDITPLINIYSASKKVDIIAFCLMPTHIHLILKQLSENGISDFLSLIQQSHSQYFNKKYERKGPLWEGRFKNVLIETDEQFLHTTRYIHLNPTSDNLVKKPEDWKYSSYKAYLDPSICKDNPILYSNDKYLEIDPSDYVDFINERIEYQKILNRIKHTP